MPVSSNSSNSRVMCQSVLHCDPQEAWEFSTKSQSITSLRSTATQILVGGGKGGDLTRNRQKDTQVASSDRKGGGGGREVSGRRGNGARDSLKPNKKGGGGSQSIKGSRLHFPKRPCQHKESRPTPSTFCLQSRGGESFTLGAGWVCSL